MEQFPSIGSYAARRKLFRDVWETSTNEDDNNSNVLRKPKVIRTLKLSELNRFTVTSKKKRLKKLKTACKRLLHFCDYENINDLNYAQICHKKCRIGNSKFVKRKKHKFLHKNILMRNINASEAQSSPSKLFNTRAETSWSGSTEFDIRINSSKNSSAVSLNKLSEVKSNRMKFLQPNHSKNKKSDLPTKGSRRVKSIMKNLHNVRKELVKMHVINIQ